MALGRSWATLLSLCLVFVFLPCPLLRLSRKHPPKEAARMVLWTYVPPDTFEEYPSSRAAWANQINVANALQSWAFLPHTEVLVFADRPTCGYLRTSVPSLKCLPAPCMSREYGRPNAACMWRKAATISKKSLFLGFSSPRVALFKDFVNALEFAQEHAGNTCVFGRGRRLMSTFFLNFSSPTLQEDLFDVSLRLPDLQKTGGIDFFALRRGSAPEDIPFSLTLDSGWRRGLIERLMSEARIPSLDVSEAVHAFEFVDSWGPDLPSRSAAATPQAHYRLVPLAPSRPVLRPSLPRCPPCEIRFASSSLELLLDMRAAGGKIVFTAVSASQVEMAFNWVCSLHHLGSENYVLLPTDREAHRALTHHDLPSVLMEGRDSLEQGLAPSELVFRFIRNALERGVSLVFSQVTSVFLRDPHTLLEEGRALSVYDPRAEAEYGGAFAARPELASQRDLRSLLAPSPAQGRFWDRHLVAGCSSQAAGCPFGLLGPGQVSSAGSEGSAKQPTVLLLKGSGSPPADARFYRGEHHLCAPPGSMAAWGS